MSEVRVRKRPASFFDRLTDHVNAVVILVTDRAGGIEQQVPLVATKVEHALARPARMRELLIEISKLRRLHELRTQRLLFRRAPPEMDFLDHHKRVRKVSRKGAKFTQRRKEELKLPFAPL